MASVRAKPWALLAAFVAALGASAPAAADGCVLCGITPGETPPDSGPRPLEVEFESTLNFDRVIVAGSGAGIAIVKPDGASLTSGAIESLGGKTMVGRLVIRGDAGRAILIDFPPRLDLTSMNGGTLVVESVVTDLPPSPSLDQNGQLIVNFGGELKVEGGVDGDFRGNLLIRADYL